MANSDEEDKGFTEMGAKLALEAQLINHKGR